jgi:branched-chain amino acid transport system substrate-binding protein
VTSPWPEPPSDLSTEVSRVKAARPDVIAPITRPASAQILLPEIRKQRLEIMGIVSPGSPGLYEAGQLAALKEDLEHVLTSVPWANFKNPRTTGVAEAYRKRSGGKTFDTNSGYSYDGIVIIADVLERARSTDPDAIVDALKKTSLTGGLMQYGGPIVFNELGDNPNAITTMIQILGQKPVAVWPREAALQKFVFPRPRA